MDIENETNFSPALLTFAAVMTFLIMVVGIFGNFLTVIALIKCPKVRNVAAAFIISLCLADLLFCALVLPFSGLRFIEGTWNHGRLFCKIIPFIQYGNIGVSLLCIAMITINRYVMIAHHSAYNRIYKKQWIAAMIVFCWLFAYGMQLPTLLGVWGTFDFDPKLKTCSIMPDENGHSSKTALFIIAFVIPCLIIIACYTKIFWVVHESETRLKKHANKELSMPNNLRPTAAAEPPASQVSTNLASDSSLSTNIEVKLDAQKPTRVKDQREMRAKRNEWRITKMVLAIFLSFIICYLPITLAKVVDKDVEYPSVHVISYIMLYLSSCINPIIYVIMNKQYRKAYKTVLTCESLRALSFRKKPTANGAGGSVTEKWKDTAFHNNHSRTLVSQMSTTEQQVTTTSSSQATPPMPLAATTFKLEVRNSNQNENPSQTKSTAIMSASQTTTNPINPESMPTNLVLPKMSAQRETHHNRIALVGGDIILEEEEEPVTLPASSSEAPPLTLPLAPSMSIIQSKKVPYYGQNINVTPAEQHDSKLSKKLKM